MSYKLRHNHISTTAQIGKHTCIASTAAIGGMEHSTHDIPPYTISYGVPAKVVKRRFESERKEQLVKGSRFWEFEPDEARAIIVKIENIE